MGYRIMAAQAVQEELDFSIVSPKLTIEAMRDSGYRVPTTRLLNSLTTRSRRARLWWKLCP